MDVTNHDSFYGVDASALAEADTMRPIAWGELAARLTAQRDLARLLRKQGERRPASFGHLESLAKIFCEQPVNQGGLCNGKTAGGKDTFQRNVAATGDRGPQ